MSKTLFKEGFYSTVETDHTLAASLFRNHESKITEYRSQLRRFSPQALAHHDHPEEQYDNIEQANSVLDLGNPSALYARYPERISFRSKVSAEERFAFRVTYLPAPIQGKPSLNDSHFWKWHYGLPTGLDWNSVHTNILSKIEKDNPSAKSVEAFNTSSGALSFASEAEDWYTLLFLLGTQWDSNNKGKDLTESEKGIIYDMYIKNPLLAWAGSDEIRRSDKFNVKTREALSSYIHRSGTNIIDSIANENRKSVKKTASFGHAYESIYAQPEQVRTDVAREFWDQVFGKKNDKSKVESITIMIGFNDFFAPDLKEGEEKEVVTLEQLKNASKSAASAEINEAYAAAANKLGVKAKDYGSDPSSFIDLIQCYLINEIPWPIQDPDILIGQDTTELKMIPQWFIDTNLGPTIPAPGNINLGESSNVDGPSEEGRQYSTPNGLVKVNEGHSLLNKLLLKRFWKDDGTISDDFSINNVDSTMNKKLFWVYKENGVIKKEELFLTKDRLVEDYWMNKKDFNWGNIMETSDLKKNNYFLEKIDVKFEGTNPSTARKDVQVEMEFKISSLDSLDSPISKPIWFGNEKNEDISSEFPESSAEGATSETVKLFNLVTLPNDGKISGTKEVDNPRAEVGEYSPDYSRVRLVIFGDKQDEDSLIVDLTTIDHSISRDSETGETSFKINYRGYFESSLSMPDTDVLSTAEFRETRSIVKSKIRELKAQCSDNSKAALKEAIRLEKVWYSSNTAKIKTGTIINDLMMKGKVFSLTVEKDNLVAATAGIDFEKKYSVERLINPNLIITLDSEGGKLEDFTKKYVKAVDAVDGYDTAIRSSFVFFADLMDTFFSGTLSGGSEILKNLKMLFGEIHVEDPLEDSGYRIYNPLDIPIDLGSFSIWFDNNVTSKGVTFYPAVTFLRNFLLNYIDRFVGNVCYEYRENRSPNYRFSFFSTSREAELPIGKYPVGENGIETVGFDIESSTGESNTPILPRLSAFDMNKSRDYVVFYQHTNSNFSGIKFNLENNYVPTIIYGVKNNKFNCVSDVSFSKTDSPFLREARYFNNDYGSLSLLSNVYDLDFSFKDRNSNTIFYPGVIFEFILLDWGNEFHTDPLLILADKRHKSINIAEKAKAYEMFGEANPHVAGTVANITGFGGYYIVKSVEYSLGQTNQDYTIKISSKFIGTNHKPLLGSQKDVSVEDSHSHCNALLEDIISKTKVGE